MVLMLSFALGFVLATRLFPHGIHNGNILDQDPRILLTVALTIAAIYGGFIVVTRPRRSK